MKSKIAVLVIVATIGIWHVGTISAKEHPELDAADQAYSAENYEAAAALYRKDAELGVISAQLNLAIIYSDGLGVPQDYRQAAKWFQKAAEQGNAEAQLNLGLLYLDGKGLAHDLVEADKWFKLAGAKSNSEAAEKQMSEEEIAKANKLASQWRDEFNKSKRR